MKEVLCLGVDRAVISQDADVVFEAPLILSTPDLMEEHTATAAPRGVRTVTISDRFTAVLFRGCHTCHTHIISR